MITGPSSYDSTMTAFAQHWAAANVKLNPKPVILTLPDNTSMTQVQFVGLRTTLLAQQDTVQTWLVDVQIARGVVNLQKAALLAKLNLLASLMDASYQTTGFFAARPYAPGIGEGKDNFLKPMSDAMKVWKRMNEGAAPTGVTLPLVLGDGTDQGTFASAVSSLIFAYASLEGKEVDLRIARGDRNVIQERAYAAMKTYREGAENKFVLHPELIESLPRLTPLPGHTPEAVNASAVFETPDQSKVVYDASTDSMLEKYELRGCVGDDYSDEDSFLVATHLPGDLREFLTPFGLNQPGAKVALKVYVILTTGNEAGSAVMFVQRPASVQLAA